MCDLKYMDKKNTHKLFLKAQIFLFISEPLSM